MRECISHHYACDCREEMYRKRVMDAYRAGFIEACKWPEPVTQDVDSKALYDSMRKWIAKQDKVAK